MALSFLGSFGWFIVLTLNYFGWGLLYTKIFRLKSANFIVLILIGIAIQLTISGYLQFFKLFSRTAVFILVGGGLISFILLLIRTPWLKATKSLPALKGIDILLGVILILFLLNNLLAPFFNTLLEFNQSDDYQCYLTLPLRTLQTGTLGANPFHSRQLLSSLGGNYVLSASVFAMLPLRYGYILDYGLGTLLIIGLIMSRSVKNITPSLIAGLYLLLSPPPIANSSPLLLPAALIFLMLNMQKQQLHINSRMDILLTALLFAAVMVLKSNLFIFLAFYLFFQFLFKLFSTESRHHVLGNYMMLILLILLFSFPYMMMSYKNYGTFFYPYLGKGDFIPPDMSEISFGNYTPRLFLGVSARLLIKLAGLAFLFVLLYKYKLVTVRSQITGLFLATALCITLIIYATQDYGWFPRYFYSFYLPVCLIALLMILSKLTEERRVFQIILFSTISFVLTFSGKPSSIHTLLKLENPLGFVSLIQNYKTRLNAEMETLQSWNSIYSKLLAHTPENKKVLASVDQPFMLDYSKRDFHLIDQLFISPPPYIPLNQSKEIINDYILNAGYGIIVLSYNTPRKRELINYYRNTANKVDIYMNKINSENELAFHQYCAYILENKRIIFDDGENAVVDITQNRQKETPYPRFKE